METIINSELQRVMDGVCGYYHLNDHEIQGNSRMGHLAKARGMFIKLCFEETRVNTGSIGRFINRDHATVIYYKKKMSYMSPSEREDYMHIKERMGKPDVDMDKYQRMFCSLGVAYYHDKTRPLWRQ